MAALWQVQSLRLNSIQGSNGPPFPYQELGGRIGNTLLFNPPGVFLALEGVQKGYKKAWRS
jgi:hypothetical protein